MNTAEEIHGNIVSGKIDVSNESFGIKVGMAAGGPGGSSGVKLDSGAKNSSQSGGCC